MQRDDVLEWEKRMMEEVVKRRKLGGYSVDAEGILKLCELNLALLQHLKDTLPRTKK